MAKTKTKGTAKTVSDTPVPQPITISSTNPKIMADNIKKLEKAIKGADDASEISYDNTESHLTASNVQAAIDEVVTEIGSITSPAASDVSYDNTDSGLTADDVQDAIDEVVGDLTTAVPCQLLQIPNIGEHTSIRLNLADSDTFCIATFVGTTGTYAQFLITATAAIDIVKNGYSVTKNADRDFTVTCTGNWSRAVIYAFAPVLNAVTYTIP